MPAKQEFLLPERPTAWLFGKLHGCRSMVTGICHAGRPATGTPRLWLCLKHMQKNVYMNWLATQKSVAIPLNRPEGRGARSPYRAARPSVSCSRPAGRRGSTPAMVAVSSCPSLRCRAAFRQAKICQVLQHRRAVWTFIVSAHGLPELYQFQAALKKRCIPRQGVASRKGGITVCRL